MEEPPVALAPKVLLSGAVPLEAFLATLQKVISGISYFAFLSFQYSQRNLNPFNQITWLA